MQTLTTELAVLASLDWRTLACVALAIAGAWRFADRRV